MEFMPPDERAARRVARHLASELGLHGIDLDRDAALDALARLYGHASFAAMRRRIGRADRSRPDDESSPAEVAGRRSAQAGVLAALGLGAAEAFEVLDAVRPTARRILRGPGGSGLVTFLDVTHDRCELIVGDRLALMADALSRERRMDILSPGGGVEARAYELFMRTMPENVGIVARRLKDGPFEVSFGLVALLGHLSRSAEEAALWAATIRELWRRLGSPVRIGHFAEAFACGVPTEESVAETAARRAAGERTSGIPRYPHEIPEGQVGFMLCCARLPPRFVAVSDWHDGGFAEGHRRLAAGAAADPTRDGDANLGLTADVIQAVAAMPQGDPEEGAALRLLLWLASVNPGRGPRDVAACVAEGARYVTMTLTPDRRVRTSAADAFEDRTRMIHA